MCIFIGGAVGVISACSDDNDCSMAGRPMMYCTLSTINPDTKAVLNDTLDSLTITAIGTDSIILNNEKKVHKLMLPLRYTNDTTAFVFRYDYPRRKDLTDTLLIIQSNTPFFQSMECGYMMKQNILGTHINKTQNKRQQYQMDSVDVKYKEANTNEIQNLQIFYKYRN